MVFRLISPSLALAAIAGAVVLGAPGSAVAGTVHADRSAFLTTLDAPLVDGYGAPYPAFAILSDAAMSAVVGETDYESTGFNDLNIVSSGRYCAGCNGSFRLSFGTTSVGTAQGVFGVGLDIVANSASLPYDAFVTFGDGSTQTVDLGSGSRFFGITSDLLVSNILFTEASGGSTTSGSFQIDNLTIGAEAESAAVIPLPASLPLMIAALLATVALLRRRA